MFRLLASAALAVCLAAAPGGISPIDLLRQIRQRMADNLTRLPNYTCRLTIERNERVAPAQRFEPIDTLHLEVALAGQKELFAWPGESKFEEKGLDEMVPWSGGALGTGDFALHAHAVFVSTSPTFTYVGESTLDGRKTIQFDYRVPQQKSRYEIRSGQNAGVVGYHGSFWVDAETLDLIRLQVQANEIPPNLNISQAEDMLDYQRVRIGEADFLLPRASELMLVDAAGNASRNRTQFANCRQYTGESVVRFTDPDAPGQIAVEVKEIPLPANVSLSLELAAELRGENLAVGDPVRGRLVHDAKHGEDVLFPKGAVVTGHLTRAQKRHANIGDYWVIGMQLSRIEAPGRRADLRAALDDLLVSGPQYLLPFNLRAGIAVTGWSALRDLPPAAPAQGEGVIFVKGSHLALPAGLRMVWRTI